MSRMRRAAAVLALALAILPGPSLRAQSAERIGRIGVLDGAPEYTFGRVSGVAFLPDGRIVALDALPPRLLVYERDGTHVVSFGSGGPGPGEFERPVGPFVTADQVGVYDARLRRVVLFTHDGHHLDTRGIESDARLGRLDPLRGGRWIGGYDFDTRDIVRRGDGPRSMPGRILLLEEAATDTLAEFRSGATFWYDREGGSFGPYQRNPGSELLLAVGGDSLVVMVDAVRGRIRWDRADPSGLEPVAERDLGLDPRPLDLQAVMDSIADALHDRFPNVGFLPARYWPYFDRALVDERGRVWLRRVREEGGGEEAGYLIVPMDGGEPITVGLPWSFRPTEIRGDTLLGVGFDELGVSYVDLLRVLSSPPRSPAR